MKKIILFITLLILINFISIPIYANTEEADITKEELDQILETAVTLEKVPNINSRNAIVYDRTSRNYTVWKKGKFKMQDGFDYKNININSCSRKY